MNFFVVKKRTLLLFLTVAVVLATALFGYFLLKQRELPVFTQQSNDSIREIDMITIEFHTKTKDGKDLIIQR